MVEKLEDLSIDEQLEYNEWVKKMLMEYEKNLLLHKKEEEKNGK